LKIFHPTKNWPQENGLAIKCSHTTTFLFGL
jgi:hypothetical protein